MSRFLTVICCCLTLLLTGCSPASNPSAPTADPSKLQVVVSFNAMKELAQVIGQDKIEIHSIVPDGEEPHEFEPKATDLTSLAKAQVFIISGMGMEGWADKAIAAAANDKLIVVDTSTGIEPITPPVKSLLGHQPNEPQHDPHTWLSLQNADRESRLICDAFIKADPANRDYYEHNYQSFHQQLQELYRDYEQKFAAVPQHTFVTGHAAFGYLARDFNLDQDSLTDVFAAGEPSARRLTELANRCHNLHIKVIFVENMENPRIAQTLAQEIDAHIEGLDTLESSSPGKNYVAIMRENLEKIYQSLY